MMNRTSWWIIGLAALLIVVVSLLSGRVYFNVITKSLPSGIYIRKEGAPALGQYALSCLTPDIVSIGLERKYLAKGPCPTGIIAVGKIIKAVPGMRYSISKGALQVGGESFIIREQDKEGRPLKSVLPEGEHIVGPGKYLLLSNYSDHSWDSRYWGPVPVEFLLQPLVVFHEDKER